jgi:excisionase family DNA binding protein
MQLKDLSTNGITNGHGREETPAPAPRVDTPGAGTFVTVIEPLLVDLDALCRLLSVSRRTGKRMVAENAIPGIVRPFGRTVRFELAAVKAWIAKGCPKVRAPRRGGR